MLDDIRYALRSLRRNPILTSVAMASLAIGIGANTAIFSLMDRMLFRTLPVRDPQQLVLLRSGGGRSGSVETSYNDELSFSWPKYRLFTEQTGAIFEGVLARFPFEASVASNTQTDAGRGEMVTGNYFRLLGVHPALGRLLDEEDTRTRGANPVATLSYGYWTRRFGRDPGILNHSVVVNGKPLTVVGVAQAGFRSVGAGEAPELFVPITMMGELTPSWGAGAFDNPHAYWLNIFGRLRPGVSREQARAAAAVVWKGILAGDAGTFFTGPSRDRYLAKTLDLLDGGNGISSVRDDFELPLYLLMGMVGLVLLIACANIANLLLARAVARGREMAIRISLGASRGRLIRHILVESMILSIGGAALGLLVASWAGHFMLGMVPGEIPIAGVAVETDGRVLAFTCGVAILTGLLFGCAPGWRATRPDLAPMLKESAVASSGSHARFRRTLVAGQIAISAVLLASAGLFAHSLHNLRTLDPGFRAGGVGSFGINPRLLGYDAARSLRLFRDFERELHATPGVSAVSMAKWPLLAGATDFHGFLVEGYQKPGETVVTIADNQVGSSFFSVMGIPLLAGREFHESDSTGAPAVAVVNESLARKYFAGRNPIGLHLTWRHTGTAYEIVGVVKDAKYDDLREVPKPFVYLAAAQDSDPGPLTFYVRTQAGGESLGSSVRSLARRLDPALPVSGPVTVEQQILNSVFVDRMVAALASTFAILATVLAAIGLYGVVAWAVTRRKREIGIRMALGAEPAAVMRMVLAEVLWLGAIGVAIAAPLWLVAGRLLKTLLFGVTERDPFTLALALVILITVAAAAGFVPAWRASRIDPTSAIRYE